MNGHTEHIALFWDFENIHASVGNVRFGPEWYRGVRFARQPEILDIGAIMEFVNGLGVVNVNRAYANWSFLTPYSQALHNHSIDLVQMFPRGMHGKNGADIRLATDVIEEMSRQPHLGTIVIVGGDSDYIAVAQKVKQRGKRIVGIGVKETSNQFWVKSCNEFKFYGSLVQRAVAGVPDPAKPGEIDHDGDPAEARDLLRRALGQMTAQSGNPFVLGTVLKQFLLRLDPSFDENDYGAASFGDFLEAHSDLLQIHQGGSDWQIALRAQGHRPAPEFAAPHPHVNHFRAGQLRLVGPELLDRALEATWETFRESPRVESFPEFKRLLAEKLGAGGTDLREGELNRVKAILFKAAVFHFLPEPERGLVLAPSLDRCSALKEHVYLALIGRLIDAAGGAGVDAEWVTQHLLPPGVGVEEAKRLIALAGERPEASADGITDPPGSKPESA